MPSPQPEFASPVDAALSIIGGKWKLKLLYRLLDSPKRFGELQRSLPHITQQMLTLQLRELEQDGVIHRELYPQVPPKVEYSLTEFGRSLTPVITTVCDWGRQNLETIQRVKSANQMPLKTEA
jgi:DNA-binding HxlR family transcriptional regulator